MNRDAVAGTASDAIRSVPRMPRAGRHTYAHGRLITKRRLIGAVAAVAVIGCGVAAAVFLPDWLGSRSVEPTSSPTAVVPSCPSTRLAGGDAQLGTVAWVDGGALLLLDLDTCEERTLVQVGAAPPVRFSHDGAWVAFGDGSIVPAAGGDVLSPIGTVGTLAVVAHGRRAGRRDLGRRRRGRAGRRKPGGW